MKRIICIAALTLLCLVSCSEAESKVAVMLSEEQVAQFSTQMTASHDNKYYTLMGVNTKDGKNLAVVNVFSDTGDYIFSFEAGNVDNFRGACWENDSYNIWTLSGDNTLRCYKFSDEKWALSKDETIPQYMPKK